MNISNLYKKLDAYERLMRLDKPIGILLLLWPTLWALFIAGNGHPNWRVVIIFVMGTVLMRSAGCVLNDIADRNFDGLVERTKTRPLATLEVSVKEAYILATVLAIIAFIFVCFLNKKTIYMSFAALFLAMSYPYTKRYISMPQAYLGIAFGFGIPMAFTAILSEIPLIAWMLLLANIFWAIAYDTAYAMVDREDDLKIRIKSSAILFGKNDVVAILICYGLMLLLLVSVGVRLGYTSYYYAGLAMATLLIYQQYSLIKKRLKADCFKAFMQNTWIGFAILLGIIAELSFRHPL
jgi:4-hydroxybenzoate polyprenyltransferase